MALNLWLAFVLAAVVIALSPGPGAALSMSAGLRHGQLGALPAIFGLQAALLIQLAIVGAGLGTILTASATAFAIVKFTGAAYLIWLGIQALRHGRQTNAAVVKVAPKADDLPPSLLADSQPTGSLHASTLHGTGPAHKTTAKPA